MQHYFNPLHFTFMYLILMLQYHITKLQNKGFYRQITEAIKRTESHVVLSVAADFGTIQLCITQAQN